MAERSLQFTATIPAGTAQNAPVTVATPFDGWDIESIDLEVPPGPTGTMGFVLSNNGQPWIPRSPGQWIVWDDHAETFYPVGYPTGGGWAITGYNVGKYDHTVTVRFNVNPLTIAAQAAQLPFITFIERDVKDPGPVIL